MRRTTLEKSLQVLLILFLALGGLYFAKPFLVPVCFAGLFAMLFLPVCRKLERSGVHRGLAILVCILFLLLIVTGVIMVITWQVTNLTNDLGNIEAKFNELLIQFKTFLSEVFGINQQQQQQIIQDQSENATSLVVRLSSSIMSVLVNFLLILVYVFLFIYYRTHIKKFILDVVPKEQDANAEDAIKNIEKVSQKYLSGLGIMIICLWIMYSIGFAIVGLKNAIFFAIMCGLFEIVPFIGNLTGNALAVLMALTQGGGISMVIGILITYSLVQFLQSYILEPLVVGTEVNINPLFTIIGLVVGQLIWGIPGLILAIPLLGIVKIICDHIPILKPYGALIGRAGKSKNTLVERIKMKFK